MHPLASVHRSNVYKPWNTTSLYLGLEFHSSSPPSIVRQEEKQKVYSLNTEAPLTTLLLWSERRCHVISANIRDLAWECFYKYIKESFPALQNQTVDDAYIFPWPKQRFISYLTLVLEHVSPSWHEERSRLASSGTWSTWNPTTLRLKVRKFISERVRSASYIIDIRYRLVDQHVFFKYFSMLRGKMFP